MYVVHNEVLKGRVRMVIYFYPKYLEEFIRIEKMSDSGDSMMWKTLVGDFPFIEKWLDWKMDKYDKVIIGEDPWVGCYANYMFPNLLLLSFHNHNIFRIENVNVLDINSIWNQGWNLLDLAKIITGVS